MQREPIIYDEQFQNEGVVLASLLKEPSLLEDCMIQERHFIDNKHKNLFRVMKHLKEKGESPDYFTLIQQDRDTLFQIGGRKKLDEVKQAYLTTENFDFQQKKLLHFYSIERAREQATGFLEETSTKNETEAITDFITTLQTFEGSTVDKSISFKERVQNRLVEHMDSPADGLTGIHTGFMNLNVYTDGWQRRKLHIIGARPSVGKTAFILNTMLKGSKKAPIFPTLFSLETSDGDLIDRLIAAESRINLTRIKNVNKNLVQDEQKYNRYMMASQIVSDMDMDIREDAFTVNEMRAILRQNMKEYPDKEHVVFIDYLTLMKGVGDFQNKHLEIEAISNGLKQMAKDFNVPVIALAQLSRGVENRQDKRPVMSDLRESGSIEQIADMISFLHRDDYQNYENEGQQEDISDINFIVAKNRDGRVGALKFKFTRPTQEYHEVTL